MRYFYYKINLLLVIFTLLISTTSVLADSYVGSTKSNKYHYSSCRWAQKIRPENRIIFKSAKEARDAGYIPCKVCKPPLIDR